MLWQAVIEHPAGLDVFEQDEAGDYLIGNAVMAVLADMIVRWPDAGTHPGSRINDSNRQTTHALLESDSEALAQEIDALIAYFSLPWQLQGLCSAHAHLRYDEQGDPILTEVNILDDQGEVIGTEMRHVPEQIVERALPEAVLLDFMADETSGDPPVASRPTEARLPHVWVGMLPVVVA
ncbi:MAG: hypothetical protein KDJ24_18125 [Gammaproteobacteria bacterium]|nr:hypothetical protein [Gammaproteobacteria bacterium]